MKVTVQFILLIILSSSCYAQKGHYKNYNLTLTSIIKEKEIDSNRLTLEIDKSDYKLTILSDTVILKEYPVVFGKNPKDDKLRQGDNCTPEGTFIMNSKYPHKKWSKFIWINYPTEDSWHKHNAAIQTGIIPQNSKIGGEIGIHGVPENMDFLIDIRYNWTLGCISLKNKDIDEIYQVVTKTSSIVIKK
jgi:murein L,D-transpeptidase YafK